MDTQGQNSTSLLALPLSIRRKIYADLGFQRSKRVDLNSGHEDIPGFHGYVLEKDATSIGAWSSRRQQFYQRSPRQSNCRNGCLCAWCYPLSNQLFYVSRAISKDAISIFYSSNQFRVSDGDRNGLFALRNLGPTALGSLRWISVRLGTKIGGFTPCHGAIFEEIYGAHEKNAANHPRLQVISEWAGFCVRLAAYVKPHQLDLHVICGAYDMLTAERYLLPLLNLTTLKHCSIHLGPSDDSPLQMLIERIVAQTTQYTQHAENTVFPFLDLPIEIQLHVLEHTELIAPFPLAWKANHPLALTRCRELACAANIINEEASYCPSTHTAYSSIHCCWRKPISLFQVSREIRQYAQYIFYSQNQFHITVDPWCLLPSPDLEIPSNLQSLKPFPRDCLQHLRYIEWAFTDELEAHLVSPEQDGHPDWINVLDLISQNIPLSRLTFILSFGWEAACRFFGWLGDYESKNPECYEQIVKPMTRLEGLKDYFIHLSWPVDMVDETGLEEYEQRLEKLVMGDGYDSFARGKVPKRVERFCS